MGFGFRTAPTTPLTSNTANANGSPGIYLQSSSNNTLSSNTAQCQQFVWDLSSELLQQHPVLQHRQFQQLVWDLSFDLLQQQHPVPPTPANSNSQYGIYLNSTSNNNILSSNTAIPTSMGFIC